MHAPLYKPSHGSHPWGIRIPSLFPIPYPITTRWFSAVTWLVTCHYDHFQQEGVWSALALPLPHIYSSSLELGINCAYCSCLPSWYKWAGLCVQYVPLFASLHEERVWQVLSKRIRELYVLIYFGKGCVPLYFGKNFEPHIFVSENQILPSAKVWSKAFWRDRKIVVVCNKYTDSFGC